MRHRERPWNKLRDYSGTFGAAGCISVPFRSTNGGEHTTSAFQKPLIFKALVARSAENLTRADHFGELVRTPPR
jgi:hypothetical protein